MCQFISYHPDQLAKHGHSLVIGAPDLVCSPLLSRSAQVGVSQTQKIAKAYKALHVAMSAKMSTASILVCQGHMSMTFEVGSLWGLCPLRGVGVGVAEAYRALHVAMSAKIPNASILVCQGHISMIFEVGFLWGLGPLEGHLGGGGLGGAQGPSLEPLTLLKRS